MDLDAVTTDCVNARASNGGQTCAAPKRFIVQNTIKDEFTKLLVDKLSKVRIGDPMDPSTDVGSLITEKAALEAEEAVAHTVKQGASCVMGGKRYDKTYFGFKMSGIGREGVSTTLEEMSQLKSYIIKGVR